MKRLLLITATVFLIYTISKKISAQDIVWNTLPNALFASIPASSASSNDTALFYVANQGNDAATTTSSLYYYSFANSKWSMLSKVPGKVWNSCLEPIDSCLYIIGGDPWSDITYSYNLTTGKWNVKENMPTPRQHIGYSSVVIDSFIYVIGGLEKGNMTDASTNFEQAKPSVKNQRYNSKRNKWEELAPMPTPRQNASVVAVGSLIYVIGGEGDSISVWTSRNTVEIYNTMNNTWSVAPSLPFARSLTGAELIDKEIWVLCGWNDGYNNIIDDRIFIYNTDSSEWKISSVKTPKPISYAGITSRKNKIYVVNGCSGAFTPYNSVYELWKRNPIDYFGQTPPADTAVIFAPGIVSINGRYEYGLSISPDGNEIFFAADTPGEGLSVIKKVNGQWSESQTANLRGNNSWEFEAFYSVDGQKLFFTSDTNDVSKFWFANKTGSSWGSPEYLDSPVNNTPVMWCTFTSDETMYYGNNSNLKIHRTKLVDGKYSEIENLDIKGTHPSVAADESYFLFNSSQYGGYGKNDILIVFKKGDNTWSEPINLGNKINTSYGETCASLSPDGKYIFFSRYNEPEEKCNIYWVSTKVIEDIKELHNL